MEKKKKPIFKKWWFWVIIVLFLYGLGSASGNKETEKTSGENNIEEISSIPVETNEEYASEVPIEETSTEPEKVNPLDSINLSVEEKRIIYSECADAYLEASIENNPGDELEKIIDDITQNIADTHGVTAKDVENIYTYGNLGYLYDIDLEKIKILHGELLDVTINGTTLIIKAKISPSYSNKATIDQNYYNVCDIIRNQEGKQFDLIDYWAVADMSDGSESKVISFTVEKDLIATVSSDNFADNTLGDYLNDLWVLPSLTTD